MKIAVPEIRIGLSALSAATNSRSGIASRAFLGEQPAPTPPCRHDSNRSRGVLDDRIEAGPWS